MEPQNDAPKELGFEWYMEGGYWHHEFGNELEIALEPYGANEYLFAVYQAKRLLTPKFRAWIHASGILLVAGLPLNVETLNKDAQGGHM